MQGVDIPAVACANVAAWQKAFRGILSDRLLDDLTQDRFEENWKNSLQRPRRTNLVVEAEQGVIGFVAFGPASDGTGNGEVYGIYVHPDHWRMGAGSLLMAAALEALKSMGFERAMLWTMTDNSNSRRFYEKIGWSLSGETRISERQNESFEEVQYWTV